MFRWNCSCASATLFSLLVLFSCLALVGSVASAADGNRLAYLDECNPWSPHRDFPKLITPQWIGEAGVDAVVVLAIDDMRDTAKYEQYLRPILNRLKQIDGRAPVSIMTCDVRPGDPQLQSWLDEGLSIEVHTADHPCPLLQGGDFEKAKSTYDRCIDLLHKIPGSQPVAFRTPCCDSLNTVSPRFYSEIFNSTTPGGHSLQLDSSVFNFFTSEDETIPKEMVLDKDGNERFWKYLPRNNNYRGLKHDNFVNYIKNYPYPYVINNTCWQFPCVAPSDWSAQHLHGVNNPVTVDDWKAALDITVHKQGVFNLVFHPHGWITAEQVVELIDHAVEEHGRKVKFLTFREAAEKLNENVFAAGDFKLNTKQDCGVRLVDVNDDQFMDVVIGHRDKTATRIWDPRELSWREFPFPARFDVKWDGLGPTDTSLGHCNGRLAVAYPDPNRQVPKNKDGTTSGDALLNVWPRLKFVEWKDGEWKSFGKSTTVTDDTGRNFGGPMLGNMRWRDLDGDGSDELVTVTYEGTMDHIRMLIMVGRQSDSGNIDFTEAGYPGHLEVQNPGLLSSQCFDVDKTAREDATLQRGTWTSPFVFHDIDGDRDLDLIYSDCSDYCVFLYSKEKQQWDEVVLRGKHNQNEPDLSSLLPIERRNSGNNGFFIHNRHLCWQNEDTAHLPDLIHRVSFDDLLAARSRSQQSPK